MIRRRLLLSLALLAVSLVALAGTRKRWGTSGWRPGAPPAEDQAAREARMERQLRVALARINAKRKLIQQVLAGRLGLLEAAARFRDLNDEPADCPCRDDHHRPGASRGENLCRQVLIWAREVAREQDSSAARATVARLEAELKAILARDGDVRLPGD
jgi:hypothetical protein